MTGEGFFSSNAIQPPPHRITTLCVTLPGSWDHDVRRCRIRNDNADNTSAETREMERALATAGIPHEVHYFNGMHSRCYWSLHLADSLGYVGAHLFLHSK